MNRLFSQVVHLVTPINHTIKPILPIKKLKPIDNRIRIRQFKRPLIFKRT